MLLVSEAADVICKDPENALVHPVGEVKELTRHPTMLDRDRAFLEKVRLASLHTVHEITWSQLG